MNLSLLTLLVLGASQKDLPDDTQARVRRLEHIVTAKAARDAGRQFPEGELFTYEFFGLALANIAESTHRPADIEKAVTKGEWLLERMDDCLEHAPFLRNKGLPARGGIIWMGGRNLLLARLIRLNPKRWSQKRIEQFHRDSRTLHQVFVADPSGIPETFPDKRWPVDGLFALESLRIHDALYGTQLVFEPLKKWIETMRRGADLTTHLMPSYVNAAGDSADVPRGCAMSWSLTVLPNLAPALAAEQWSLYKKHFLTEWLGFPGFREFPPEVDRNSDIDSGPVIAGVGLSASALGMAAARVNGDLELATKLERVGDTLRLFVGEIVFFEVMTLWVKTVPISTRG